MGWNGAIIGGCVGSWLGKLPGIVIGGLLGHFIEEFGKSGKSAQKSPDVVFCASAAAMLAKMAKVDGFVSKDEIFLVQYSKVQYPSEKLDLHKRTAEALFYTMPLLF
jgi:hypothetical protein